MTEERQSLKKTSKIKMLMGLIRGMSVEKKVFPSWVVAKKDELNIPRKRHLDENDNVIWDIGSEVGECADHFEMSGFMSSTIISYGKDNEGKLLINKHLVVPSIRIKPNETNSSYGVNFIDSAEIVVDGKKITEYPVKVSIKGVISIECKCDDLHIIHSFYPSNNYGALIEEVTLRNVGKSVKAINVKAIQGKTVADNSVSGKLIYSEVLLANRDGICSNDKNNVNYNVNLNEGETFTFNVCYVSYYDGDNLKIDTNNEISARKDFIKRMSDVMVLNTPDRIVDAMFGHCKIRANESIFKTPKGLMHSPGGGGYYYAMWTNDECEYANPFFAYMDYAPANEESINCYRLYADYMDMSDTPFRKKQALITSIISGGAGYWNGAGDRGDAAMYGYGISRYLLVNGDRKLAKEMMPYIKWCVNFSYSRLDRYKVIRSHRDELEGRFKTGKSNLCTNCLVYDMLRYVSIIARELGDFAYAKECNERYRELGISIDRYFAGKVQGYDTYRYYKTNRVLRSWICMPLTVGIYTRAKGTVEALFGKELYKDTLLKTAANRNVTWDRSLLFAIRGVFRSGFSDKAYEILKEYSASRLIGSHVPYPFEAFPEGNRKHLSGESALYNRIITEGMFGIHPAGFDALSIKPSLPKEWSNAALKHIRGYNRIFDIELTDKEIKIIYDGKVLKADYTQGDELICDFNRGTLIKSE